MRAASIGAAWAVGAAVFAGLTMATNNSLSAQQSGQPATAAFYQGRSLNAGDRETIPYTRTRRCFRADRGISLPYSDA